MSFGLLRLPRMPELKKAASGGRLEGFVPSTVDPEEVPYKDKARERQRQAVSGGKRVVVCVGGKGGGGGEG